MTPARFASRVGALGIVEMQKLRHDRRELYTRALQPLLWLVVFGTTFSNLRAIPTGGLPYLDYLAPGIIAQSVLMMSIFFGILLTLDREIGILTRLLVTPTPRVALVAGKAFAGGIRSIVQAAAVMAIATALGVSFQWHPLRLIGVAVIVFLAAAVFTSFSIFLAGLFRSRELMGLGQIIILPLFFGSNALYPVSLMPPWLQAFSAVNPLSYAVDALRYLLLDTPGHLLRDVTVLSAFAVVMICLAASTLGRLAR